jgi:hypothetical protein
MNLNFSNVKFPILLLILASLHISCASAHAGIAASNIPIIEKKYSVLGPVETKEYWIALDFAVLGFSVKEPPINKAMQDLQDQKKADALINIRYWNDRIILLFVTVHRMGIQAEAIQFERPTTPSPKDSKKQ